jgi:hypothetical protein
LDVFEGDIFPKPSFRKSGKDVLRAESSFILFLRRSQIHRLSQQNVTDSFRQKKNVSVSAKRVGSHLVTALRPAL